MIKRITREEFTALPAPHSRTLSAENRELLALKVGEGFSTPCRWNHHTKRSFCAGTATLHSAARRHGCKIRTRCIDKTFYVLRIL